MENLSRFEAGNNLDALPCSVRAVGLRSFPSAVCGDCFLYLAQGAATLVLSGASLSMQAGELLIIRVGVPFACVQQEHSDWYWADAVGSALPALLTTCGLTAGCVFRLPEDSRIPARYAAIQQAAVSEDGLTSLSAAAQFLELLVAFGRVICPTDRQATETDPLDAILSELQHNFAAEYSVQELAHRCHVSVGRFSLLFKARTSVSPQRYLIDLRLTHAQQLLRDTRLSIQQIAAAVGYSDAFYFSRLFRSHIGLSPSTFRKHPHPADAL